MFGILEKKWQVALIAACTILLVACAAQLVTPAAPEAEQETVPPSAEQAGEGSQAVANVELLPESAPAFDTVNWRTDFSRRTVEWSEILSGGPPKDGIPSIDNPTFEGIDSAAERLSEQSPVIVFEHEDDARAYPLDILIWHEIVNDEVGGKPVAVTFCPLCNASIVFDREFDGRIRDFGTTGKLRNSDLIMYDRQSETWWQQFTGTGIVGKYAGAQLDFLPSQVLAFGDFAELYPDGQVLAIPTEFRRSYGRNPYELYDSTTSPFLFNGEIDGRLRATERVVGVDFGNGSVMAYPFEAAAEAGVINDAVAGTDLVIFHKPGTASALDAIVISEGRDIGSVGVFNRAVDGQTLTFNANGNGTFTDAETGSTWTIAGEAVDGELTGTQLEDIISFDHFWFAWAAFFPETGLYEN